MPKLSPASISPCGVSRIAPATSSIVYAVVLSANATSVQKSGSLNQTQGQIASQRACTQSSCATP